TRMPTLLDLPDETLLAIFLQPRLSYNDLKRISRTCKKLHSIEQDESLDSKLFRKGLPPSPSSLVLCTKGIKVDYHPILDKASLTETELDDVILFVDSPRREKSGDTGSEETEEGEEEDGEEDNGYRVIKVKDVAAFNEYATSPPCREIVWEMGGKPRISNPRGVTVRDAVVAAVEMWSSEPGEEVREQLAMSLGIGPYSEETEDEDEAYRIVKEELIESMGMAPGQKLTWRHTLGDHCFWEGMEFARARNSDVVVLVPRWFGS
ncbi:hypothetical protein JCM3765_005279, partial [Sporobolomyces pararoseus]